LSEYANSAYFTKVA